MNRCDRRKPCQNSSPDQGLLSAMVMLGTLLRDRRFQLGLGAAALGTIATGLIAWGMGLNLQTIKDFWKSAEVYLVDHPGILFASIVFLPALPIPTSALLFLAGAVWKQRPVTACALCLAAMILNMSWTYWVAAYPARALIEKMLRSSSFQIPDLPKGDQLRLIMVLRLTPGIPLFFQNYLLGFFKPPFLLYLAVSLACSGAIICGVVLSGAGIADGNLKPAITGFSLIALAAVITQMIRRHLAKRKKPDAVIEPS